MSPVGGSRWHGEKRPQGGVIRGSFAQVALHRLDRLEWRRLKSPATTSAWKFEFGPQPVSH